MTISEATTAFLDYKLYFRRLRPQSIYTYRAPWAQIEPFPGLSARPSHS